MNKWTCMSDDVPPSGVPFVLMSIKRKTRQYVIKNQWSENDKRENKSGSRFLYWVALPEFKEPQHED